MTLKLKVLATFVVVAVLAAAVAAQQPVRQTEQPAPSAEASAVDPQATAAAQVLQRLRAADVPAPVETGSIETVLRRYDAMIATGAKAAATPRRRLTQPTTAIQPSAQTLPPTGTSRTRPRATALQPDTLGSLRDEEVRSILTEVRTLILRLEQLLGDSQ